MQALARSWGERARLAQDRGAHGGRAEDAFDVVLVSIPGYGFSDPPRELGWDADRTARARKELMHRLGYARYVAQGGDAEASITDAMARQAPEGLIAIHLNFLPAFPPRCEASGRHDHE
jgi:pimeloyl-ACP methyl ester carboxylesterase